MSHDTNEELTGRVNALIEQYPPATTDPVEFLGARFDAGLAWVRFPLGHGGLALGQEWQSVVDDALRAAGAPEPEEGRNIIGFGSAGPTIAALGTEAQKKRFLRPLYTCEEIWCQLFSEPGAGSDLAAVATRAVRDGEEWVVNGQKVWTSGAHSAQFAILVTRTDPDVPKHAGITYFLCDMSDPGIEIRPLRQLTGEAEFNEVFLTDVRVPDSNRIGAEGEGWKIANATLNNERLVLGGDVSRRESGHIGVLARRWREAPEVRNASFHDRLMRLWVEVEATRLMGERVRQQLAAGQPGAEGAAMKLAFSRHAQAASSLGIEMEGANGLRYDDWTMKRPNSASFTGRGPGYRYLRAKGNSIEGGTSEILRSIVSERILGLPSEHRVDKTLPFKDLPR